jgi:hypothetical protein
LFEQASLCVEGAPLAVKAGFKPAGHLRRGLAAGWQFVENFNEPPVIAGLDPAIHHLGKTLVKSDGCPGQARA